MVREFIKSREMILQISEPGLMGFVRLPELEFGILFQDSIANSREAANNPGNPGSKR